MRNESHVLKTLWKLQVMLARKGKRDGVASCVQTTDLVTQVNFRRVTPCRNGIRFCRQPHRSLRQMMCSS